MDLRFDGRLRHLDHLGFERVACSDLDSTVGTSDPAPWAARHTP
jgi:hypothetical protein